MVGFCEVIESTVEEEENRNETCVTVGFEARKKICCAFCTGFIFSSIGL